jgi:hypothetical protein
MGGIVKLGCIGIIALVAIVAILAVVVGNQPKPQQQVSGQPAPAGQAAGKPELAKVGQTASLKGWEVTVTDFGPYDRFAPGKAPAPPPQGKLVVADMRVKNLQNATSNFTQGDFSLKAGDGREFKPAGQTATIERGFVVSQTVQPGLVTENRVVFDIAPDAKDLVFNALGMQFSVPNP